MPCALRTLPVPSGVLAPAPAHLPVLPRLQKHVRFLHPRLVPFFFLVHAILLCLLAERERGIFALAELGEFLMSQRKQIPCFGFIGSVCSGMLAGVSMFNTVYNNLIRNYNNLGFSFTKHIESSEYLAGMERRWCQLLHEIAGHKRSLAIMKRKHLYREESEKQVSFFRRLINFITFRKDKHQNEVARSLSDSKTMQEEAYMRTLPLNHQVS